MKTNSQRNLFAISLTSALALTSVRAADSPPADSSAVAVSKEEARAVAKKAYIYGFPIVDYYRVQYAYFVDTKNPEYKAPWNQILNIPRVFTPEDKAIQTPNSDTPYSILGLDLRGTDRDHLAAHRERALFQCPTH